MKKNKESENDFMLTTFDNPFNPFDEFEIWWKTDLLLGYDCCSLLAKEASISSIVSEEQNEIEIDRAMDEICRRYPTIFKKVTKQDYLISA